MAKEFGIYKCELCGNVVSVMDAKNGTLACCGQDMNLLEAKSPENEGKEKHAPVVEISDNKVVVNVGSIDHPMEESHFIGFIQLLKGGKVIAQKMLFPGQKPHAEFCLKDTNGVTAREYCNLHGLWKS